MSGISILCFRRRARRSAAANFLCRALAGWALSYPCAIYPTQPVKDDCSCTHVRARACVRACVRSRACMRVRKGCPGNTTGLFSVGPYPDIAALWAGAASGVRRVCVRACVRACARARACVRACVPACVRAGVRATIYELLCAFLHII